MQARQVPKIVNTVKMSPRNSKETSTEAYPENS